MKVYISLLLFAASCLATQIRFDNFQVYRVTPLTIEQLESLQQLSNNSHGFSFWKDVSGVGQPVDIMVPPHLKYDFEDFVRLQKLHSELWIENLQKLIDSEQPKFDEKAFPVDWKRYHTLDEIYSWLKSLAVKYPNIVKVVEGGRTYEGRQILGVHVSFKPGNKAVFLEGGIHAREWISPATATYILNQFLTSTDPAVRALAESRDWYVFPSFNPDGYVYTHVKNRLWRKTRKPYGMCVGADPNRNWGYHWMDGGASSNPCFDTFAGSHAFSEIETESLSKYISSIAHNLEAYIAFHSYSQFLLIPFGHAGLEVPTNNEKLHTIGKKAVADLAKRYGTKYKVGNIPNLIHGGGSGGSSDWVLGNYRQLRLTYTFELRDTGKYGFLLPTNQIIPTAEETLDAVVSMFKQLDATT